MESGTVISEARRLTAAFGIEERALATGAYLDPTGDIDKPRFKKRPLQ